MTTRITFINEDEMIDAILYAALRRKVSKITLPNDREIFFEEIMGAIIISEKQINTNDADSIPDNCAWILSNTDPERAKVSIRRLINEINDKHASEQFASAGVTI